MVSKRIYRGFHEIHQKFNFDKKKVNINKIQLQKKPLRASDGKNRYIFNLKYLDGLPTEPYCFSISTRSLSAR